VTRNDVHGNPINFSGPFIMKKTIATLIAGLFATAAFAQTPAPAAPATTTAAPATSAAVKADVKEAKADAKEAKADANDAKMSAKHAKAKTRHAKAKHKRAAKTEAAKESKDTTVAAAPAPAAK
jgi:hypothetical protein